MMRRYGLPYKGSKNAIADWVIEHLPESGTLVDLFCGGCAVTHAALLSGKWERIIANDLHGDVPQLFMDAIAGKYTTETEKRWISREDFFRLKDTDAYVRLCWSFGNDSHTYLYAKEIEPFKKRLHELVFADTIAERMSAWRAFVAEFNRLNRDVDVLSGKARRLCAECGAASVERADGSIDAENTRESIFRAHSKEIREYMRAALRDSEKRASDVDRLLGTNGMAGHYFGESQWALPTEEAYEEMKTIIPELTIPWTMLNEKLNTLESLQRLQRLQRLQGLQRLQRLQVSGFDYRDVEIPGDAVVYCDIPYNCTADNYGVRFDRAAFLDWADVQTAPIIISEYCIDDDRFTMLAEIEKRQLIQRSKHQKKVTERLYCPKRQADEIRARLTLQEKMTI